VSQRTHFVLVPHIRRPERLHPQPEMSRLRIASAVMPYEEWLQIVDAIETSQRHGDNADLESWRHAERGRKG